MGGHLTVSEMLPEINMSLQGFLWSNCGQKLGSVRKHSLISTSPLISTRTFLINTVYINPVKVCYNLKRWEPLHLCLLEWGTLCSLHPEFGGMPISPTNFKVTSQLLFFLDRPTLFNNKFCLFRLTSLENIRKV